MSYLWFPFQLLEIVEVTRQYDEWEEGTRQYDEWEKEGTRQYDEWGKLWEVRPLGSLGRPGARCAM